MTPFGTVNIYENLFLNIGHRTGKHRTLPLRLQIASHLSHLCSDMLIHEHCKLIKEANLVLYDLISFNYYYVCYIHDQVCRREDI